MRVIVAIAVVVTAAFFMSQPVLAAHCMPREVWIDYLKDKYGEQLVGFGVTLTGGLMEKFATPDGKTWTLLITDPKGISCGIAAGENWQKVLPKLLKPMGLPV